MRYRREDTIDLIRTNFYSKGIIHREFVPQKQIVIEAFYLEVLGRLLARIRHVRRVESEDLFGLLLFLF